MLKILFLLTFSDQVFAAVLRSYSSNGNFNIFLTAPVLNNTRTKIEVKTVRPYNASRLFTSYHLSDGSTIIPLVTISDMDTNSRDLLHESTWISTSLRGYVFFNTQNNIYKIVWLAQHNYTYELGYQNRGMELSDLKVFDGNLLSPGDKTGVIYKLRNNYVVPWVINADGDGENSKPFKAEWMTIKNEELYVGGYGKEFTDQRGNFMDNNPMYVKVISRFGEIRSESWVERLTRLRSSIGIEFPNYIIHESCQWSDIHRKWFFLPRKVAFEPFDNRTEEMRETNDTLIVALKTEEVDGLSLTTYSMIFGIDGTVYMDETKLPGNYKMEGLEFVDWNG
uniref:Apyrase n=1 Tax=Panagrolaimus superbus TaxID=310955 RepID=A0A914YAE0_9BILA